MRYSEKDSIWWTSVSYTHLDVYKRQYLNGSAAAEAPVPVQDRLLRSAAAGRNPVRCGTIMMPAEAW